MKRSFMTVLSILFILACSVTVTAQSIENFYTDISPVQPTQTGDNVEVLEIFWYGCPHCYAFEPYIQQWLKTKPGNVEFRLMPGILNENWIPHAKAYYTAVKLGVLDKIHHPLFTAIHKNRRKIYDDNAIKAFFIEQGVDGKEFSRIYNSSEIELIVRDAINIQRNYRISGVPSVIINGKYRTSPSMARSYDNLLKVMDYLVDKESEGS